MLDYQDETSLTTFNRGRSRLSLTSTSRTAIAIFSETEEVTRGGKRKKKSTTALGVMHADYFFFLSSLTHPPLDRGGNKRNATTTVIHIARLSITVHVIPFFSCSETKDVLEKEKRKGERKIRIFLSYKIHFSDPLGTLERVGFR